MSNDIIVGGYRFGLQIVVIVLSGIILYMSVNMTKFGILQIPIDISELSPVAKVKSERNRFAKNCKDWISEFGYRLICRKAVADHFFALDLTDIGDPRAKQVLDDVLRISTLEPAYYALRARIGLYTFEPMQDIVQLLRLSYLSGRAEQNIMSERFQIALAVWSVLDESDKSIALNDFIKNYTAKREDLYQLILSEQKPLLKELLPMIQKRDPALYDRFIHDMAAEQ